MGFKFEELIVWQSKNDASAKKQNQITMDYGSSTNNFTT